jgi:hypothetical protein
MCILNLFSDRLHIVAIEETAKIVEVKMIEGICLISSSFAVLRTSMFAYSQKSFIF